MYYTNLLPNKVLLSSGTSTLEIWPMDGALLNSWKINDSGIVHSIVEGYKDASDFSRHAESKGFRSCKLSPYVCRINKGNYTYHDKSYHIGKFMLNGASIHGLLYDVPFDVIGHEANEKLAMVILQHHYAGSDDGYPFAYSMVVTYTLTQGNMVTISTEVTNKHSEAIPMADGWHPYFSLGGSINDQRLQIASDTMLVFDENLIPNGELTPDTRFTSGAMLGDTQLDNCFLLQKTMDKPACTLTNEIAGVRLSIYANANYPYLQLYTPPGRAMIAIENLSAAPDAFNNKMGLIELEPEETISFSASYKIELL